jgi:hypothetical protein
LIHFQHPTINGTIEITWTNNSDVTLDKLGIHLWPNAYSNKNTALGQNNSWNQGDVTYVQSSASDLVD